MKYLLKPITNKIIINKSEFFGLAFNIGSTDEIPNIIKTIKKQYPKADHYCYAYITSNASGSNDDGEPSGTAGMPILEILKHFNLTDILVVVIRYFGGIMLGAGGLIRAYGGCANELLKTYGEFYEKVTLPIYLITLTYPHYYQLEKSLAALGIFLEVSFGEFVIIKMALKENSDSLDKLKHHFISCQELASTVIQQIISTHNQK